MHRHRTADRLKFILVISTAIIFVALGLSGIRSSARRGGDPSRAPSRCHVAGRTQSRLVYRGTLRSDSADGGLDGASQRTCHCARLH